MVNDTIETLDDLHDAMITRYPALADRERYAAIYAKMERQWVWFDALPRQGQDRLAVMAQWVRLDTGGLDGANTLCAIDIKYAGDIELEKADYQRKFADLSEDMNRTLHAMTAQAHHEIAEATRDLPIERADAQENDADGYITLSF